MRILIVGLNYAPEVVGIAPYNTELAEHLASRGHRMTVLTSFPYYPHWRIDPDYRRGGPFLVETVNSVRVIRCPFILPGPRPNAFRRILFDSSMAAGALLGSVVVGRQDLVICISPPLQLGVTSWLIARSRQARLHLHLQDIVPDAALSVGMMHEGTAVRISRLLERFVYSCADTITVISEGFSANLRAKGVPAHKLSVLPNWVETARFRAASDAAVRMQLGASNGELLVLHTGNMGAKQGLETVVDAAAQLGDERVVVALVGDGNQRSELEARVDALGLSNVRFVPLQSDYPATLAAADLLVLAQRGQVMDSVAPSKLLSYMASGKPVVAAVNRQSEAGRVIREAECGVVVPPEDPSALATAVRALRKQPGTCAALGEAGRRYVMRNFDRSRLLESWSQLIERVPPHLS